MSAVQVYIDDTNSIVVEQRRRIGGVERFERIVFSPTMIRQLAAHDLSRDLMTVLSEWDVRDAIAQGLVDPTSYPQRDTSKPERRWAVNGGYDDPDEEMPPSRAFHVAAVEETEREARRQRWLKLQAEFASEV